MAAHESSILTYSDENAIAARKRLVKCMNNFPGTPEEKERSLGLFVRGSLLARMLAIADIYQRIVALPGIVVDVGTWRGQTAVLCENLRAIYEPLHFNRRIVAFDTFEGYAGFSAKDKPSKLHKNGSYTTGEHYADYLAQLLELHEQSNAMGHNHGKHHVIAGDCRKTIPAFFKKHPNECVALSFFDVNAYDPTAKAFEELYARTVPGGIMAFWQLTRPEIQAEGRMYAEQVLGKLPHKIYRSPTYPGLCFMEKQ